MIKITQRGDLKRVTEYLYRIKSAIKNGKLDAYGREGVAALMSATPRDSGLTASSWYYRIEQNNGSVSISFHNSHINDGVNIAIILQYGHGTGTGGWVEGRDYINPAIQPIFDKIADNAWKEVTRV